MGQTRLIGKRGSEYGGYRWLETHKTTYGCRIVLDLCSDFVQLFHYAGAGEDFLMLYSDFVTDCIKRMRSVCFLHMGEFRSVIGLQNLWLIAKVIDCTLQEVNGGVAGYRDILYIHLPFDSKPGWSVIRLRFAFVLGGRH